MQIALLCWTHGVIGWGFFIFGTWIPTYLDYLGVTNLKTAGYLSALPWAVSPCAMHTNLRGQSDVHQQRWAQKSRLSFL